MKKIALILALALAVSLAACSQAPEETPENTEGPEVETPVDGEVAEDVVEEKVAPTLGTLTIPNKYLNKFLGITSQFTSTGDNKWICNTNAQNLEKNGFTENKDGNYESQMKNADYILDYYAVHDKKDYTASVVLDNLDYPKASGSATAAGEDVIYDLPAITSDISETEYINTTLAALTNAMAGKGIVVSKTEVVDVNFAGVDRKAIYLEGSRGGVKLYQKQVIYKQDGYMVIVTASTTGEKDETDSILNMFKAVE